MEENIKETKVHIHFVGVGGCGVSAVAFIAFGQNYLISGSDLHESVYTKKLQEKGISITVGPHKKENVPPDTNLLVRSPAVGDNNLEVIQAKKMSIPVLTHAQLLGILMEDKYGICKS